MRRAINPRGADRPDPDAFLDRDMAVERDFNTHSPVRAATSHYKQVQRSRSFTTALVTASA